MMYAKYRFMAARLFVDGDADVVDVDPVVAHRVAGEAAARLLVLHVDLPDQALRVDRPLDAHRGALAAERDVVERSRELARQIGEQRTGDVPCIVLAAGARRADRVAVLVVGDAEGQVGLVRAAGVAGAVEGVVERDADVRALAVADARQSG